MSEHDHDDKPITAEAAPVLDAIPYSWTPPSEPIHPACPCELVPAFLAVDFAKKPDDTAIVLYELRKDAPPCQVLYVGERASHTRQLLDLLLQREIVMHFNSENFRSMLSPFRRTEQPTNIDAINVPPRRENPEMEAAEWMAFVKNAMTPPLVLSLDELERSLKPQSLHESLNTTGFGKKELNFWRRLPSSRKRCTAVKMRMVRGKKTLIRAGGRLEKSWWLIK